LRLLLIASILVSLLYADDIARMESIVKDVSELRHKYEQCQDRLDQINTAPEQCAVNKIELKERHQEILLLQKKSEELEKEHALKLQKIKDTFKKLREEKRKLEKEMIALKYQPQISKDENSSSSRDIEQELSEMKEKNTQLKVEIKEVKASITQKENFPTLAMKEGYENLQKAKIEIENFDWNASATYRLKNEAKIYDGIDGNISDTWEEKRSFTSMNRNEKWIQITGYFVDKKWQSSRNESLWVKTEDAFKR